MRPPYCISCNAHNKNKSSNQLYWNADFSTEDFGYDTDGIIGVYSCSGENCGAVYEIADFFLEGKNDIRVIKYYRDNEQNIEEKMISNCLYCSSELENKGVMPSTDVYGPEFENEGVTTTLCCPKCETIYDVVDIYPTEELYQENCLDIRDSRTIFIK